MALPILQTRGESSSAELLRLLDKTEFHLAGQLGEEEWLSAGAAFANGELASVGVLLLRDGKAIGRADVVTIGEIGRIEWVYVTPQWRRQGIGRAIVSRTIEMCARSLFKHVFAVVDPANMPGNRLLSQFGFRTIATVATYQVELL